MKYKKSAKDIAFDKERNKLNQIIRSKEREIHKKDFEIYTLNKEKDELQSKIDSQNEWIERLLEYTEMSKEDLDILLSKSKLENKLWKTLNIGIIGYGNNLNRRLFNDKD